MPEKCARKIHTRNHDQKIKGTFFGHLPDTLSCQPVRAPSGHPSGDASGHTLLGAPSRATARTPPGTPSGRARQACQVGNHPKGRWEGAAEDGAVKGEGSTAQAVAESPSKKPPGTGHRADISRRRKGHSPRMGRIVPGKRKGVCPGNVRGVPGKRKERAG